MSATPDDIVKAVSLPPKEAMAFWQSKKIVTPKTFAVLREEARVNAFMIGGVSDLDIVQSVQKSLQTSLDEGLSFGSWKKQIADDIDSLGWTGKERNYRLQNVFRTNLQTAYATGRYKQLQETKDALPYWRYSAVNDSRTRPTHAALDNKVFPADHPFWDTWYPPNGFMCRCTVSALSKRQVEHRGLTVESETPDRLPYINPKTGEVQQVDMVPDTHFGRNVAKDFWQPDLKKYPVAMRQAYLERIADHICPEEFAEGNESPCLARLKSRLKPGDLEDLQTLLDAKQRAASEGYSDWINKILHLREQAADQLRLPGEFYPVGNIPAIILERLQVQAGVSPRLALIVLDDKQLIHLTRESKAHRGAMLAKNDIARIPDMLTSATWHWDTQDSALLMVWDHEEDNKRNKVVIRLDWNIKKGKNKANLIRTAGIVQQENLEDDRYMKL